VAIGRPKPRAANQEAGFTCAACHLTPDGKSRGPHGVDAPHATVKDHRVKTSIACAFCHSEGERVCSDRHRSWTGVDRDLEHASYRRAARILTASGARTSLFVPELGRLFVAARGNSGEAAAVWVFHPAHELSPRK
jgi:hypothetical protein